MAYWNLRVLHRFHLAYWSCTVWVVVRGTESQYFDGRPASGWMNFSDPYCRDTQVSRLFAISFSSYLLLSPRRCGYRVEIAIDTGIAVNLANTVGSRALAVVSGIGPR